MNVEEMSVTLNITEIPSQAFTPFNGKLFKFKNIHLNTLDKVTIKRMAFYNLDNLSFISLPIQIHRIQDEAFAFETKSNEKHEIRFYQNLNNIIFEQRSFDRIQRPTTIGFSSNVTFIPETAFKSFLNDNNNKIQFFFYSFINCSDCRNQWLIRDKKDGQVFYAKCMHNQSLTLFSSEIKSHFNSYCNLINSINYDQCRYHFTEVSFHLVNFIFKILLIYFRIRCIVHQTLQTFNKFSNQLVHN